MSIFGFGPSAKVEIQLTGQEERSLITVESEEKKEELPIYSGDDAISGTAKVIVPSGKKLDHVGIKIELIGAIGASTSTRPPRPPRPPPLHFS